MRTLQRVIPSLSLCMYKYPFYWSHFLRSPKSRCFIKSYFQPVFVSFIWRLQFLAPSVEWAHNLPLFAPSLRGAESPTISRTNMVMQTRKWVSSDVCLAPKRDSKKGFFSHFFLSLFNSLSVSFLGVWLFLFFSPRYYFSSATFLFLFSSLFYSFFFFFLFVFCHPCFSSCTFFLLPFLFISRLKILSVSYSQCSH